ncbi:K(+)-transporting ATPase subunit F [Frigoribacterium sp. 2-23]
MTAALDTVTGIGAAVLAVASLAYLVYALVKPERF